FNEENVLDKIKSVVPHALESEEIAHKLFNTADSILGLKALEGLLVSLTKLKDENGQNEQAQRAHYFFRNIEGLWACSNPKCTEVDHRFQDAHRFIGKLYRRP